MADQLELLLTAVTQSPKYRHVSPDLIRRIGARQLQIGRSQKEATKATKNKLHQVGGAYFASRPDYDKALHRLQTAVSDPTLFRQTCRQIMQSHASTRERLPILAEFYRTIFTHLPPIHSIVDIACGLNPLTIPWMNLTTDMTYDAYDIYGDMLAFLAAFWPLVGVLGRTHHQDIISQPPTKKADLVFILKTLPCLEQSEKGATTNLLDAVNGHYLLISYPAQSLGGRRKGMAVNYEAQFAQLAHGRHWQVQKFEFDTELAFLVRTF
ncbi:MAG: 16S rRNA methyltransferase [Chloroflexi bacterium]|nr:16S rRNA methyltransferase [Chloroflexota bacterium]